MVESDVYLSIIIPAYNEQERIVKTLKRIFEYLENQRYSYEIILVSDGSKDETVNVAKKEFGKENNFFIVDRKQNYGKGYTVREGMLKAKGGIRLFTDADNSTDISHFELMRSFFDKGYDIVIGSRDSKDVIGAKQAVSQKWHKRLLGNLGNLFIQLVAVRGVWDTQCGFKAFRDYAAERIFSKSKINRWGFDIEALALARKFGFKIGIIPVFWINDPKSHVKFSAYFQVLWETVKIKLNLIKGNYK
jgi:dolichyl-phosphate beta-glucosyltransferase